jgi:hypoxanthine phosphoribosyltransferase
MKHHSIPFNRFRYPVGDNIGHNAPYFRKLVEQFSEIAEEDIIKYNRMTLVCQGSSGSIVATIFYLYLTEKYPKICINIVTIKKDNESSHSTKFTSIPYNYDNKVMYVWVDDHIDQGDTIKRCRNRYVECDSSYSNFLFDWAVCLSSEYSLSESKQLEFFETVTKNMVCNIGRYCSN